MESLFTLQSSNASRSSLRSSSYIYHIPPSLPNLRKFSYYVRISKLWYILPRTIIDNNLSEALFKGNLLKYHFYLCES